MSKYDLMRRTDKELMKLYEEKLGTVGDTSLSEIILEFDRRKSRRLAGQMNLLTVIIAIIGVASVITSVIQILVSLKVIGGSVVGG